MSHDFAGAGADTPPLSGLRAIAHDWFWRHAATLRHAGLVPSPAIELHDVDGMTSYCDTSSGHVYLGVADGAGAPGALQVLYLQSLYGIDDLDDLEYFVRGFLPWTPAHELGHHLRVEHGRFSQEAWWEEQIANRVARALASATCGRERGGGERARLLALIRGVVDRLGAERGGWRAILDSYDDVLPPPEVVFAPEGGPWISVIDPRAPRERLAHRRELIARFDLEYGRDELGYLHQQLGWIYLALIDPRPISLSRLREHFH